MTVRELSGTTAIVTGASKGFGRATAIALAGRGAHVVGVARSEKKLNELRSELGHRFTPEVVDVSDPGVAQRLLSHYRPQTLVLNAGAKPVIGPLQDQTWETFSTNWNTDAHQVFHFVREALTYPLEPGSVVVSLSSAAALRGSPLSGGYAGAKATVRFISAYAGAEATSRSLGLRYVAILPMLTPATDLGAAGVAAYAQRAGLSVEAFEDQLGPVLTPEHFAKTMADVATDDGYSADAYLLSATELRPLD
jgi:NADP-dependent 3-hydroxy acid dehydrogenase YdfG